METEIASSVNLSLKSNNTFHMQSEFNSTSKWDLRTILETASLSAFTVLGIAMSIFVFVMYRNKRSLRTSANIYVLSLTTSNFLRSVFLIPFYAIFFKRWMSGEIWCICFSSFNLYINLVSVLSILLIAFDRNCAVKDPLHYVMNNSKRRAGALIICVWFFSILLVGPIFFGIPEFDYSTCDIKISSTGSIFDPAVVYESTITFTALVVPLSSVACLYYGMYRAARNNVARDERNSCSSCVSSDVVVNMKSPSSGDSEYSLRRHFYIREGENSQQKNRFLKKHRAAVTGLLVVLSFIICWSPYFIVRFYQQFRAVTIQIKFWIHFSTFLSSIVDPYVYFYRNRSTWNYTKKLASHIFYRKKSQKFLATNMKSNMVSTSNLYHISTSLYQTEKSVASQSAENRNVRCFSKTEENGDVKITLYEQDSLQNKNNVAAMKQFVHQDSSSSNTSSDVCPTIMSSDSGETMRYQSLRKKLSEESSFEESC